MAMRLLGCAAMLVSVIASGCTGGDSTEPSVDAAGTPERASTTALEAGATALQGSEPPAQMDVYLVGFHPLKSDPQHQFEAHHFCQQVNEDFMQCVLFDGNSAEANLNGVEYIISAELYETLPEQEKQYWHPHNGEILSGQLVAPGLPKVAEHALMASKINSYGKTWHTWRAAHGTEGTRLPLGKPDLAWSFNRFGEARPGLVESRDERMDIDTEERRRARRDLIPQAEPQRGVDALKRAFPRPTQPIPGVEARNP